MKSSAHPWKNGGQTGLIESSHLARIHSHHLARSHPCAVPPPGPPRTPSGRTSRRVRGARYLSGGRSRWVRACDALAQTLRDWGGDVTRVEAPAPLETVPGAALSRWMAGRAPRTGAVDLA